MISGAQAYPLGQIDLPVMFGDRANFCSEVLTFEVVDFLGSYHTILGQPCYTKFMAVPNYTYLKLKMPSLGEVIIVSISFQRAYECKVECCDHIAAIVASAELVALRKEVTEETPNLKQSTGSFELVEGSKEVLIDPESTEGKTALLSSK